MAEGIYIKKIREYKHLISENSFILAIILFLTSSLVFHVSAIIFELEFGEVYKLFDTECKLDCGWYSGIVGEGYHLTPIAHPKGDAANWAFFPLHPIAAKFFGYLIGFSPNFSLVVISKMMFLFAIYAFIVLAETVFGNYSKYTAGFVFALNPFAFYAHVGYTEPLYFLLTTLAFFNLLKKNWVLSGCCGGLLSATRFVGVLFMTSYILSALKGIRHASFQINLNKALGIALIPLGLACYMYYLYYLVGDALAFKHVQIAWGRSVQNPIEVLKNGFFSFSLLEVYYSTAAILGLFVGIYLYVKGYATYATFLILTILIPLSTGLASMPRYVFWQMPFIFGLTLFFLNRRLLLFIYVTASILFNYFMVVSWFQGKAYVI